MKAADYLVRVLAACDRAAHLRMPGVTAIDGKGVVDERHPHYLGVLGIFGHPGVAGYTVDRDYMVSKPDACFPIRRPQPLR